MCVLLQEAQILRSHSQISVKGSVEESSLSSSPFLPALLLESSLFLDIFIKGAGGVVVEPKFPRQGRLDPRRATVLVHDHVQNCLPAFRLQSTFKEHKYYRLRFSHHC